MTALRFPFIALWFSVLMSIMAVPIAAQTDAAPLRALSDHEVDEPQLRSAVASRTLTWLTGTSVNNDYISVGRMANFFGFVALRVSSGQSLTRAHVARDTLADLSPSQIDGLVALLDDQKTAHQATQQARLQMNRALERLLVGETVTRDEFLDLGRAYGASEAELGRVIAQRFGHIAQTLTADQNAALTQIRAAHASGQPQQVAQSGNRIALPDVDRKELVNLAARFLSWTTGSPDFNDFEVVGKPSQHFGFVSLRLASGHAVRRGTVAQEVLSLLDPDQKTLLDAAVIHNVASFSDFLGTRARLMRRLETALSGGTIDPAIIATLGAEVGAIEADMTWAQAQAMLSLRNSMTEDQLSALIALRAKYTAQSSDLAQQDPVDLGRQLFARCALCHAGGRGQAVAPNLATVAGRAIASDSGYDGYSPSLRRFAQSNEVWTDELLDDFLRSPRALVPGTTMGFDGFDNAQERAAVVAYLNSLSE